MFSEVNENSPAFRHVFEYSGCIRIENQNEDFHAADHFKAHFDIWGSIGSRFVQCFLKNGGKIEKPSEACLFHSYAVKDRAMWNQYTLNLLGGVNEVEISLFGIVSVIKQVELNPEMYKNIFKTNGWGNHFYVRDILGEIRLVHVCKENDKYSLYSPEKIFSNTSCVRPFAGNRIFSRKECSWG